MSKELPGYRENLEQVLEFTGGNQILTVGDVKKFTGIVDNRTIHRHFPFRGKPFISAATLAYCLSGGEKHD